jgi:hypothetical protein
MEKPWAAFSIQKILDTEPLLLYNLANAFKQETIPSRLFRKLQQFCGIPVFTLANACKILATAVRAEYV